MRQQVRPNVEGGLDDRRSQSVPIRSPAGSIGGRPRRRGSSGEGSARAGREPIAREGLAPRGYGKLGGC